MASIESLLQSLALTQLKILDQLKKQGETALDGASMDLIGQVLAETKAMGEAYPKLSELTRSVNEQQRQNKLQNDLQQKKLQELGQGLRVSLSDEVRVQVGNVNHKIERLE